MTMGWKEFNRVIGVENVEDFKDVKLRGCSCHLDVRPCGNTCYGFSNSNSEIIRVVKGINLGGKVMKDRYYYEAEWLVLKGFQEDNERIFAELDDKVVELHDIESIISVYKHGGKCFCEF